MRYGLRIVAYTLVILATSIGSARAAALLPASIYFTVDGQRYDVPTTDVGDGSGTGDQGPLVFEGQGFRVTISAFLDPDPSIAYGIAVTDFGVPSSFAFAFFTPIVPVGVPNIVTGSIVGGLTDATGNGVSITPVLADADGDGIAEIQLATVLAPTTGMGVDVGPALSGGPGSAGALYGYGPYVAGPQAGPGPGPWTGLSVTTAFLLSGDGDIAALTGYASIEPVPEPATLILLGSGLVALAARRKRRR